MSKVLIEKAKQEIVREKEAVLVGKIRRKIEAIADKEKELEGVKEQIIGLKKELVEIEGENYNSLNTNTVTVLNPYAGIFGGGYTTTYSN